MIKTKSIALPQFVGKSLKKVKDFVEKEYAGRLAKDNWDEQDNPDLKDNNWHFAFGSVFRYSNGPWNVPNAHWDGSSFSRRGRGLDDSWDGRYRVVVLETCDLSFDHLPVLDESLKLAIEKVKEAGYVIYKKI